MKKYFVLPVAVLLGALSLSSCSESNDDDDNTTNTFDIVKTNPIVDDDSYPANTTEANYKVNTYNLVVNYTFLDGTEAAPSYTAPVDYKDAYNVPSPEIEGYTANTLVTEGNMPARDVIITVIYTANPAPEPAPVPVPAPAQNHVPIFILEDYDTPLGLPNLSMCSGEVYE